MKKNTFLALFLLALHGCTSSSRMDAAIEDGLSVPPHLVSSEETTVLKIFINEQGATEEVLVLKPSKDEGRDQEAVANARKMRIKPAQINGTSVKGWYILPIKLAD